MFSPLQLLPDYCIPKPLKKTKIQSAVKGEQFREAYIQKLPKSRAIVYSTMRVIQMT